MIYHQCFMDNVLLQQHNNEMFIFNQEYQWYTSWLQFHIWCHGPIFDFYHGATWLAHWHLGVEVSCTIYSWISTTVKLCIIDYSSWICLASGWVKVLVITSLLVNILHFLFHILIVGAVTFVTATGFCWKIKSMLLLGYCVLCLYGLYKVIIILTLEGVCVYLYKHNRSLFRKALLASSPWQRRLCFLFPFVMRVHLVVLRMFKLAGGNTESMVHVYLQVCLSNQILLVFYVMNQSMDFLIYDWSGIRTEYH